MADHADDDDAPADVGEVLAEVVGRMVKRLHQHCDAVQIVAVKYDDATADTHTVSDGAGLWAARYGAMKTWVIRADEGIRYDARQARESDD